MIAILPIHTGRNLLLFALIIAAALRVPGWFTQEAHCHYCLFEPDEQQHLAIALRKYNKLSVAVDTVDHGFTDRDYNVRGFGFAVAVILKVSDSITGNNSGFSEALLAGRMLSTVFSMLLIFILYRIGRLSGLPPPAVGVAALLLAVADVNATYSHYAVPAIGYVFWCYLALLGGILLTRRKVIGGLLLLAVGAGGATAFKFDVVPTAWGGLLLLVLAFRGRDRGIPAWYVALGAAVLVAAVWFMTWGWNWDEIVYSFNRLSKANANAVPLDDHFRDNLVAYPAAVLAGIGLPAFLLAVYGAVRLGRERWGTSWRSAPTTALAFAAGFLVTEAFLRYYMDTTFVRRINIFIPAVALLAAWSLNRIQARPWVTALVIAWSCGLAVVGQSNHWNDPRYAFRDWVAEEARPPVRVGVTGYLLSKGLENRKYYKKAPFDYLAFHETKFSRYYKSLTTPFGLPECCKGVYNCNELPYCKDFQEILTGQRDNLVLYKTFRAKDYFPERLLYRHFFGYYETFLGDVRVYKRVGPERGERTTS